MNRNLNYIIAIFFKTYYFILIFSIINLILFILSFYFIPDSIFNLYYVLKYILSNIYFASIFYYLIRVQNNNIAFREIINKGRYYWPKIIMLAPIPFLLLLTKHYNFMFIGFLFSFPLLYAPYFLIIQNQKFKKSMYNGIKTFNKTKFVEKIRIILIYLISVLFNYILNSLIFDTIQYKIFSFPYYMLSYLSYIKYYFIITCFTALIYDYNKKYLRILN